MIEAADRTVAGIVLKFVAQRLPEIAKKLEGLGEEASKPMSPNDNLIGDIDSMAEELQRELRKLTAMAATLRRMDSC